MRADARNADPGRPLDLTALTAPQSVAEVEAFRAESTRAGAPWSRRPIRSGFEDRGVGDVLKGALPVLFVAAVVTLPCLLIGPGLVPLVLRAVGRPDGAPVLLLAGVLVLLALLALVGAVGVVRRMLDLRLPASHWAAERRLTAFATANRLRYGYEEPVDLPGVIFREGARRTAEHRFTRDGLEVGVYRYRSTPGDGSRGSTKQYRWGYAAVRLPVVVPNVLLDARGDDRTLLGVHRTNLPRGFGCTHGQRVDLGEGFARRFTVWAPRGAHDEVRRVLPQPVRAAIVEHAADFDVELVDDTLFLSAPPFDVLDPAAWDRWTRAAGAVGAAVRSVLPAPSREQSDAPREVLVPAAQAFLEDASWLTATDLAAGTHAAIAERATAGIGPVHRRLPTAQGAVAPEARRLDRARPVLGVVVLVLLIGLWIVTEIVAPATGH